MAKEYLDDATPCTECNCIPRERYADCPPVVLCGIPCGYSGYGLKLVCPKCGKATVAHTNPQEAYREWNEVVNKEKCTEADHG